MQKKYPALRLISGLYKILAILTVLFSFFGSVSSLFLVGGSRSGVSNTGLALSVFLGGLFTSILLLAFANVLDALVDIEYNTRATGILLNRMLKERGGSGDFDM
jgi:hypothetical protein